MSLVMRHNLHSDKRVEVRFRDLFVCRNKLRDTVIIPQTTHHIPYHTHSAISRTSATNSAKRRDEPLTTETPHLCVSSLSFVKQGRHPQQKQQQQSFVGHSSQSSVAPVWSRQKREEFVGRSSRARVTHKQKETSKSSRNKQTKKQRKQTT